VGADRIKQYQRSRNNAAISGGDEMIHIRTGFKCVVMIEESDRCFCNFGERINPFCWVAKSELKEDTK